MKALELVGPQLSGHGRRQLRRHAGFEFTHAPLDLLDLFFRQKLFGRFIRQLEGMKALGFGRQLARAQAEPRQALIFILAQVILKAAPAFALQADVTPFCIKEQLDFLGAQSGV